VTGKVPIVVMAGGWCYVKELVQPHYADAFVRAGCAALVFDYRRLGASDGTPRQHLDPWDQIEDYRNAISFVETLDGIDADRIGVWGISYSGGHALIVGAIDSRVKCIVSTIPVVDGWINMERVHGALGFRALLDAVLTDRRARFSSGEHGYIPMSSTSPSTELVTWPFPEVTPVFLELQRTVAPAHEHRTTIASVELLMNYDVFPYARRILNTPTLMIVAEGDDITMWDHEIRAFNAIPTSKKRLFIVDHTTHMVLYSNRSQLEIAADQGARWFAEHLVTPYST
jgi:fermentation-respiration switch protein FrsA (DUF1100 family)